MCSRLRIKNKIKIYIYEKNAIGPTVHFPLSKSSHSTQQDNTNVLTQTKTKEPFFIFFNLFFHFICLWPQHSTTCLLQWRAKAHFIVSFLFRDGKEAAVSHLLPPQSQPSPWTARISRVLGVSNDGGGEEQGGLENNPCVFCGIVSGELPAFKLYEDDICLCMLDSNPLTHGHSLIIPKSHYRSLETTPPHVVAAMCSNVPFLSNAIMKATQSDSFNLLVNSGRAAGQVIFHTHFHIIPRKKGDRLWQSENSRRKPIQYNQETIGLVDLIKERISSEDHTCSPLKDGCCSSCESVLSKN